MSEQAETKQSSGETWAKPVSKLHLADLPEGAINLIEGQELTGPLRGFGQMWQKTYSIPLQDAEVTPEEVIRTWKEDFPKFWPAGNRFFGSTAGISPGEVGIIHLAGPGGVTGPGGRPMLSTGILVIYSDEESFSFMTPKGHPFAGIITFSSHDNDGATVAQVQALLRAFDPLAELVFRLGGSKEEDRFWKHTLHAIAEHFGVAGQVETRAVLVDPRLQWSEAKNIFSNAGFRTFLYYLKSPLRWLRERLGGKE
jgi:hypothetical protein